VRLRGGLRLVPAWDRSTLTAQLTGRVTSAAAGVGSSLSVASQRCEWRRCPSDSPVRLTAKASSSLEVNDHLDPTLGLESLNGTGRPWGRAGLRPVQGPGVAPEARPFHTSYDSSPVRPSYQGESK
jgi:hypothetical protein